ncbi:MAG: hypothetical protein HY542_03220 [Deltaproteobacteria bacterium]|nr:hypothetical protein [Deltaproteobacteria bacterium]
MLIKPHLLRWLSRKLLDVRRQVRLRRFSPACLVSEDFLNILLSAVFFFFFSSCTGSLFEDLGTNLAEPISVAVDSTNNRAYLVNSNNELKYENGSIITLDITDPAAPQSLTSVSPIAISSYSGQAYIDPANRLLFLTNRASENKTDLSDPLLKVALDDTSTSFGQVESYDIGENPFGISCCDAAGRGYVTTQGGSVVAFDPNSPGTQTPISLQVTLSTGLFLGKSSTRVAVSASQVFVSNLSGLLYVINGSDLSIDYVLTGAGVPRGIAVDTTDPDGDGARTQNLYIVDATTSTQGLRIIPLSSIPPLEASVAMQEVDIATVQGAKIDLGTDPGEIALLGDQAYVTNRGDDTVSILNLSSGLVETKITVGDEPFGLAAFTGSNGTNYLYVTNLASNSMSVIDLGSNTVVATFTN